MIPEPLRDLVGGRAGAVPSTDQVAVVVAHPDDETIGCGALLGRLPGVTLVHVTDGSPRDGADAARLGFASPEAYAATRRAELDAALRRGGIVPGARIAFDLPDKAVMRHLPWLIDELALVFAVRGVAVVVTHAYEGGHADHDCCAFAVAEAAQRAGPVTVVEMPLYRAGEHGMLVQDFTARPGRPVATRRLDERERATKRRMLAAFASQAGVLAPFTVAAERFRLAGPERFDEPPNGGRVLYERWGWDISAEMVCRAAQAARATAFDTADRRRNG